MNSRKSPVNLAVSIAVIGFSAWGIVVALGSPVSSPSQSTTVGRTQIADTEAGLRAFAEVALVLRSPRCTNCHPAGDVPRQTGAHRPHFPPVSRGLDNHGVTGMRCTACHQVENQLNGIPGTPNWSLAPREMAWEGLSDHELAEQLKDPKRNGGRTLEGLIEHVEKEPLVLWSWSPGGNRAVPPLTHEQFVQRCKTWIEAGAPSP